MSKLVNTNLDFNNVGKIVNLPDPTSAQDAATKNYVDSAIEGLTWKSEVYLASAGSNINLSAPGASLDGVNFPVGSRFLAKDQSTPAQNGIYIWNGAATPATRALDFNTPAEVYNAVVPVASGATNLNTTWVQTVNSGVVVDTTPLTFQSFGTSAPAATTSVAGIAALATQAEVNAGAVTNKIVTPATLVGSTGVFTKKYAVAFGDGSSTSYAINHNLGTTDIVVNVYVVATGAQLFCDVTANTTNQVTLAFASAPASNAYRVVVVG